MQGNPIRRLNDCHLYLCTPDRADLETFIASSIEGGVDIVQLREKELEAKQLVERALVAKKICDSFDVPFILNDRPDLALHIDADGVHVGQDDAPPELARRLLGPNRIVGFSTHQSSELQGALVAPCDYLSTGPVVATPTKPGRQGTGLAYIEEAARATKGSTTKPFFVTGGVDPVSVESLLEAGATRFVVVRYLTQSQDPKSDARKLRDVIDRGLEQHRN